MLLIIATMPLSISVAAITLITQYRCYSPAHHSTKLITFYVWIRCRYVQCYNSLSVIGESQTTCYHVPVYTIYGRITVDQIGATMPFWAQCNRTSCHFWLFWIWNMTRKVYIKCCKWICTSYMPIFDDY